MPSDVQKGVGNVQIMPLVDVNISTYDAANNLETDEQFIYDFDNE